MPNYFRFVGRHVVFPTSGYIWQHCHSFLWNAGPRKYGYRRWNFAGIPFVAELYGGGNFTPPG